MTNLKAFNEVLAVVRQRLAEDVETIQEDDTVDALDSFIAECAACVARETGLSEDEALDLVFDYAERLEAEGSLASLPSLGEDVSAWLSDAKDVNFAFQAVTEARMTAAQRNALPDSAFADPKNRKYPITDKKHAVAAAGLAGMHHASSRVKAAIAKKDAKKGVHVHAWDKSKK